MNPEISIKLHGPDLSKWIGDVAKQQIPFAMSKALNKVASAAGASLAETSAQKFNIRAAWAGRTRKGSVNAGENFITDGAAFFSTQTKKGPIANMKVKIATPSWQIAQQTDTGSSTRDANYVSVQSAAGNKISYIAIPISKNVSRKANGKLKPNAQHLLDNPVATRAFVLNGDKGNSAMKILCQREGNGRLNYKALYILVENIKVDPKFNFNEVVERTVNALFSLEFDKAMEKAIATRKKT